MTDTNTTCKLDHFPWLTPTLTVKDVPTTMSFYEKAFGFKSDMQMPDDSGTIAYGNMRYKGQMVVMLMRQGGWGSDAVAPVDSKTTSAVGLYVYCDDVNALVKQAKTADIEILCEPEDMIWGDRTCVMRDPNGHNWTFATLIPNFVAPQMETA